MKIDIYNTNKKYDIIYADPPWKYNQGGRGAAKNHYDTMDSNDIKNLPIKNICSNNAVCFMWTTCPFISDAIDLLQHWGFIYKTVAFVWVKKNKNGSNFWGLGQYTRANAELCLIGIKPKVKTSKVIKSHKVHQIVEEIIMKHSEKLAEVRDRIVALMGDIPRIELFARQYADGWDCWGNEV